MIDVQSIAARYRFFVIESSGLPLLPASEPNGLSRTLRRMAKRVRQENKDRTPFGERLFAAREAADLSQTELATRVGMGQTSLVDAEYKGKGSTFTAQLARELNVDAYWLATGEGDKHPVGGTQKPVAVDLFTALRYLSESLMRVDSLDRGMASHLLSELATNPGGVDTVAVKFAKLVGEAVAPPDSGTRVDSCQETAANVNEMRPMGSKFSDFTARSDEPPAQDQAEIGGGK